MTDVAAWNALAKLHHLNEVEVVQLMTCTPVVLLHQWQLDEAAASVREHHHARRHDALVNVLCILLRAELQPALLPSSLVLATLMVALEREERATPEMAVAVRLARVLACKLERVYQFSKSFSK
tara:strand:+ start:122 stop:493 length:372 start_codon:yes stop_codon:yes gene_type:complete